MEKNHQEDIYSELNRNFNFLFIEPEQKPRQIDKEVREITQNYLDRSEAKEKLREKYGKEFFEYTYLDTIINYYTGVDSQYSKTELIDEIKRLDIVKEMYMLNNSQYSILTERGLVSFTTIDTFLENNKDKIKNITDIEKEYIDKYKEEITNMSKRSNSCHRLSMNMAKILQMYFKIPNNIVTGYPSYYVEENKYLHSWNEFEIDGNELVIDSTMNVVMNKEGYYLIRNLKEIENISKLSAQDILMDDKEYGKILDDIDLKTYLTSRNEIIKDLEKNKSLFQKTDEEEER